MPQQIFPLMFLWEMPIANAFLYRPARLPATICRVRVLTANLDSLKIENNRAVMGGTITDSSNPSYIGKWVQLVVEDNGDGKELRDNLSWCFCQPEEGGWVPADAEVKDDDGAWWKWSATDAELKDDVGGQSANLIPGNKKGCQPFPLPTYEFAEVSEGEGQIEIQP